MTRSADWSTGGGLPAPRFEPWRCSGAGSDLYCSAALAARSALRRCRRDTFSLGVENPYGLARHAGGVRLRAVRSARGASRWRRGVPNRRLRLPWTRRKRARGPRAVIPPYDRGPDPRALLARRPGIPAARRSTIRAGNGTPLQENDTDTRHSFSAGFGRRGRHLMLRATRPAGVSPELLGDCRRPAKRTADPAPERAVGAGGLSLQGRGPCTRALCSSPARRGASRRRDAQEIFTDSGSTLVDAGVPRANGGALPRGLVTAGTRVTVTAGLRLDRCERGGALRDASARGAAASVYAAAGSLAHRLEPAGLGSLPGSDGAPVASGYASLPGAHVE